MNNSELANKLAVIRGQLSSLNEEFFKLVDLDLVKHSYENDKSPSEICNDITMMIRRLNEESQIVKAVEKANKILAENKETNEVTESEIKEWILEASKNVLDSSRREWPNCQPNHKKLIFEKGRKYFKVLIVNENGTGGSVYCFIDFQGNIFKPAGYKAPAKGIRGNIRKNLPETITSSTGWLYRYL